MVSHPKVSHLNPLPTKKVDLHSQTSRLKHTLLIEAQLHASNVVTPRKMHIGFPLFFCKVLILGTENTISTRGVSVLRCINHVRCTQNPVHLQQSSSLSSSSSSSASKLHRCGAKVEHTHMPCLRARDSLRQARNAPTILQLRNDIYGPSLLLLIYCYYCSA